MRINSIELIDWMNEHEVLYAYDSRIKKKFYVLFYDVYKVIHGQEIIYEGHSMMTAIEKFNDIASIPIEFEQPKLDN